METENQAETEVEANIIPSANVSDNNKTETEVQPLPSTSDLNDIVDTFLSVKEPVEPQPAKKKRGRPKKIKVPGQEPIPKQPTRGSTRLRKCTLRVNYDESEDKSSKCWRKKEKKQLLRGLIEVGPDNLIELRNKYLPDRTENELKRQINMWKEFAKVDVMKKLLTEKRRQESATVNCVTKLDEWLHHMERSEYDRGQLFALSNVFLVIAEYANLPAPEECGGLDFRAMYRWLHSMLNGSAYHGLNQATATVLNESISHLFLYLREHQELNRLQPHLYCLSPPNRTDCRTYSGPAKGLRKPMPVESLFKVPAMNPLDLPSELLQKLVPQPLSSDELDHELDSDFD